MAKRIVVVGSSNIDITATMSSLPLPGQTIGGASLHRANGGKGANQAVTIGRLGGNVTFITCLGNDDNGHAFEKDFVKDNVDTSCVKFDNDTPTGTALIFVDAKGENCIAVAPGSNNHLNPEDIAACESLISSASYLLLQLEVPMETVEYAVELAKRHDVKVIVNPAPMYPLSDKLLHGLFMITPNETELSSLTGIDVSSAEDAEKAAKILMGKGVHNVVVTMGAKGSLVCKEDGISLIPSHKVDVVDTTAAGDVYNGALVTALAEGRTIYDAAVFATEAAAISVTRHGAQTSVPYRAEVEDILINQ